MLELSGHGAFSWEAMAHLSSWLPPDTTRRYDSGKLINDFYEIQVQDVGELLWLFWPPHRCYLLVQFWMY